MRSANKCPSFSDIVSASDGNANALEAILKHYDSYISKSSLRLLHDEQGQTHIEIDPDLKGLIRTTLVTKILKFEVEFEVA